ncbi:MAG: hypothetical protein ABSF44_13115 [Candidatus Bathyarchaeia archaeon]|jgi:hypothetical protein
MTAVSQRNIDHEKPREYVKTVQRQQQQITLDISTERLAQIKAYIRNAERGRLPMVNDGADVTRPITDEQVQKFLECEECQSNPVVFFQFNSKRGLKGKKGTTLCVGLCAQHWIKLSDTVIGWSEVK